MLLLRKSQAQAKGLDASTYTPIAKALHQISEGDGKTLRVKFDIAHFIATQQLAFTNYSTLCQPEAKHGVDVDVATLEFKKKKKKKNYRYARKYVTNQDWEMVDQIS